MSNAANAMNGCMNTDYIEPRMSLIALIKQNEIWIIRLNPRNPRFAYAAEI